MKKIQLAILLLTIIGCSKQETMPIIKNINPIENNWTWIQSTGGIAGATYNPTNSGYTKSLLINASEIKEFKNGILIATYQYTISTQSSIYGGLKPMFVFNNKPKQSFEIINDELIIKDECYDCFTSAYLKN